jgi:ssDNA-binding Zn-finger/Zn-ribbon topoisomerase 1
MRTCTLCVCEPVPQAIFVRMLYLPCMRVNLRRRRNFYAGFTLNVGEPAPQAKIFCGLHLLSIGNFYLQFTFTLYAGLPCMRVNLRRRRNFYEGYIYPKCGWTCAAGENFCGTFIFYSRNFDLQFTFTLYAGLPCMRVNLRRRRNFYEGYMYPKCGWTCAAGENFLWFTFILYKQFWSTIYIYPVCGWTCAAGENFMKVTFTLNVGEPAPQVNFL